MTPRNDGLQEGVLPRRHLPQHVQDLPHRRTAQVSLTQGLGLVGGVSPRWLYISEMRLIVNISVHPRSSSPQLSSDGPRHGARVGGRASSPSSVSS